MSYSGSVPETKRKADWRDIAACSTEDPELFHAGERNPEATRQARDICQRCPVRTACLLSAYAEGDEYALRAGLTPRQRGAHLRKADGDVARAVNEALVSTPRLLQQIYHLHTQPAAGGHQVWTDQRHFVNVRSKPYTVHQVAWIALYGTPPVGHVQRACHVEGCVAKACLTDRRMRDQAAAAAAAEETAA